jgi:hypothetical protein
MRLRLSNPHLVPELLEFLESRLDIVTKRVSEDEVELSLLGSYNREAERMTVDLLLRAWEAGRDAAASVEFVDQWCASDSLGAITKARERLHAGQSARSSERGLFPFHACAIPETERRGLQRRR